MTNWTQIEEILTNVTNQLGGDADVINNGDCAVWVKMAFDTLNENISDLGIDELEIVNNLSEEMQDELDGYDTINADYSEKISHCYLKIDNWFFDAYDITGCESEEEMMYHSKCI